MAKITWSPVTHEDSSTTSNIINQSYMNGQECRDYVDRKLNESKQKLYSLQASRATKDVRDSIETMYHKSLMEKRLKDIGILK